MWSKTINSSSMNKSACAVSLQERKKIERYWSFFIGTLISSCYCVALKCPKAASSPADQTLDECKVRSSSDSPISSIRVRPRTKARQNKFENFLQKWLKLDSWLCWQLNCSAIQDTKPSTRATSADRQIQFFFLKVRRSWPPAAISWFSTVLCQEIDDGIEWNQKEKVKSADAIKSRTRTKRTPAWEIFYTFMKTDIWIYISLSQIVASRYCSRLINY